MFADISQMEGFAWKCKSEDSFDLITPMGRTHLISLPFSGINPAPKPFHSLTPTKTTP
jgi:hypothetical protein